MTGLLVSRKDYERVLSLIGVLSEKLMARGMMLGTAESCTGGLISALCTEVAGSSRWFAGGVVSYSNSVKTGLLGVRADLLEAHGAVSGEVVGAMAGGALQVLGADISLSVSGIAGPGGGSADKPVGTVWIGTALRGNGGDGPAASGGAGYGCVITTRPHHFPGGRGEVRFAAALAALEAVGNLLAT